MPTASRASSSTASRSVARTRSGMSVGASSTTGPRRARMPATVARARADRPERHDRAGRLDVDGGGGQRLDAADVVGPGAGEVGRAHLGAQPVDDAGLGEVAQGGDEGVAVGGRHEQAVDAVAHLLGEGADRAGQHGQPVAQREQGVLRGGGGAVGQARRRRGCAISSAIRSAGHVAGVHLDAALEARVGGQLADPAAGIPPHLAGDGEAQVGHVAQGVDEQVDALVVAHDAEREQPGRAVVLGAGRGGPPGRCGGRSSSRTCCAPSSAASRACSSEWTTTASTRRRSASISCRSPGWPSCGSTLCAMSTRARPVAGRGGAADAGGPQQGEVGGHDGGDDVHHDDDVDVTQPAAGAHPGVGAGPGEHAQGARERGRRRPSHRAPTARPGRARTGRGGSTRRA